MQINDGFLDENKFTIGSSGYYGYYTDYDLEYSRLISYKRELCHNFRGKKLEEVLEGEYLDEVRRGCYRVYDEELYNFLTRPIGEAKNYLTQNLKLIEGIGVKTASRLCEEGFLNIIDLTAHPRWAKKAEAILNIFEKNDTAELFKLICNRYSRRDPLLLYVSQLHDIEDFLFLDIETLGLKNEPTILIGLAEYGQGNLLIYQYLLTSLEKEIDLLEAIRPHLVEKKALITYNGLSFDIPYLEQRANYYDLILDFEKCHYDLLPFARHLWRSRLPNCRLGTLEKYLLNYHRELDIPGFMVPEFYHTYLQTGNVGPLVAIIEHNKRDIVALTKIITKLWEGYK